MRLTAVQKNILVNRLMDAHGSTAEACREYAAYADSVIIQWDLFEDINSGINALVNGYKQTIIY